VASLEGENLVVFYYLSASGLIRGVASLEGDNLVVFYYLSAHEIWSDKRGGLSRGEQFSSILLSQWT
jgi:hypothetical protein